MRILGYAVGAPAREREDQVAVEEPLQIRVAAWGERDRVELTVTMRTPGHDFELVAGFLVGEGIVRTAEQIATMRYCAGTDQEGTQTFNVVDVTLAAGMPPLPPSAARRVTTTSACGICGTPSIDQVRRAAPPTHRDSARLRLAVGVLLRLPEQLRAGQALFARTGGVHAAGVFTAHGDALVVREDVGRHNAVDKVVGRSLLDGTLPLSDAVLQVSGRASFELVQKAWLAGIPVLAAVGAPSSLAVELAREAGITLVAFSRGDRFNVYAHPERVEP